MAVFFVAVFLSSNHALAHSGRTDSSGGHNCYVGACAGTYHYHNGGYTAPPVYIPPACVKPTVGNNATWDFKNNVCNQDVTISWDKGLLDIFYSIQISKTPGADPGPLSDTSMNKYTFKNVKPGRWYVNVKPGRSCGWGDTFYWTIDVPDVVPSIDYFNEKIISENERQLNYSVSCADKIEISPGIGIVKKDAGSITINPQQNIDYTLSVISKKQSNKASLSVRYPLPAPVEKKQDNLKEKSTNQSDSSGGLGWLIFPAIVGGLVWIGNKVSSKTQNS